jgi:tetrapyrrole methylase family protein/MazG family protein
MPDQISEEFAKLVETVAVLRGPGGCPWDREQTHDSLKKFTIEETYEVVEAVDSGNPEKLKDELGDFILQALMYAEIANESGDFNIGDVCKVLREKLLRRHPHVFADVEVSGVDDVLHNWEQIKRTEYEHRTSALDGVPKSLPALMRAAKISKKAAKTGFDWPDVRSIVDKLKEETRELEEALDKGNAEEVKHEIGDLLFTVVNIARFQEIDPEEAMRDQLARFVQRFNAIEDKARESGQDIHDMTLEEMDRIWDEAKRSELK